MRPLEVKAFTGLRSGIANSSSNWIQKTTVAFSVYQEKIRMVEYEKEPRDVEKSNRRVEVTEEEGKA